LYNSTDAFSKRHIKKDYKVLTSIFFISTSLFSIYFYTNYFLEEHNLYINENYKTDNFLLKQISLEDREKNIFNVYKDDYASLCEKLVKHSISAENYIYC
jgi:hypothetical protein